MSSKFKTKCKKKSIRSEQQQILEKNDFPSVTVVVTAYNVGEVIVSTLDSLVEQDYPHVKIIVVDDASTDNTADILTEYSKKHSCVSVLRNPHNQGAAMAKQLGVREVKSDYFILCDGDDIVSKNAISECVKIIKFTSADVVIFGFDHLDFNSGEYFAPTLPVDVAKVQYLIHKDKGFDIKRLSILSHISPVCLLKTDVHQSGFSDALISIPYWEDIPTFISMLAHAKTIAFINEPFYHYRIGRPGQSVDSWTSSRRGLKAVCLDMAVQHLSRMDWASEPVIRKLQVYKLGRVAINELTTMRAAGNEHEYLLTIMQFKSVMKKFSVTEICSISGWRFKIFMLVLRYAPVDIVRRVFERGKR